MIVLTSLWVARLRSLVLVNVVVRSDTPTVGEGLVVTLACVETKWEGGEEDIRPPPALGCIG